MNIARIAEDLKDALGSYKIQAYSALKSLPEGDTKQSFQELLRQAESGKLSVDQAHLKIKRIIEDAN